MSVSKHRLTNANTFWFRVHRRHSPVSDSMGHSDLATSSASKRVVAHWLKPAQDARRGRTRASSSHTPSHKLASTFSDEQTNETMSRRVVLLTAFVLVCSCFSCCLGVEEADDTEPLLDPQCGIDGNSSSHCVSRQPAPSPQGFSYDHTLRAYNTRGWTWQTWIWVSIMLLMMAVPFQERISAL